MAPFLFTDAILNDRDIKVFNHGKMKRDFTYIDDIVEGIIRIQNVIPSLNQMPSNAELSASKAPHRLYNIGNNKPIELLTFIRAIELAAGKEAKKCFMEMQAGDVPATFADIDSLRNEVGFSPDTKIETGMKRFVDWFKSYYKV